MSKSIIRKCCDSYGLVCESSELAMQRQLSDSPLPLTFSSRGPRDPKTIKSEFNLNYIS